MSSATAAEAVADKARSLGVRAICVKADVSRRDEISQLFLQAKQALGRVDIIMSNSGIEHFGDLENVTEGEIDKVLAVNVKAQFFVAQEAHKHLENNGRLILISSISAVWVIALTTSCIAVFADSFMHREFPDMRFTLLRRLRLQA